MSTSLATLFQHKFFDRLGVLLVGTMFTGAVLFLAYQLLKAPIREDDLQIVAGTLMEEAVVSPNRRHSSPSITLKLTEFPAVHFTASQSTFYAMYTKEFVRDVHRGDSVRIRITKEDYRKRIIRNEPPGFFKHFTSGNRIDLYGVVGKGSIYLHPDDTNAFSLRDHWFLIILLIVFGIFLFKDVKIAWKKGSGKKPFR